MSDEGASESSKPPDPPPLTRRRVVSSAVWLALGFGYGQAVRLVSNIVLSYYLSPHDFGLMALAFTFLTGLLLFSDLGIRASIVQNPRGDEPDFLNTAWTLQILRGLALGVGACLLAWPAVYWPAQPEPQLFWMLPLFGGMLVVDGCVSTKLFSLHRHLAQGQAVMMDAVTQTAGVATTLIWAMISPGVLALAAGPIVNTITRVLISHLLLPGQNNSLHWDRSVLKELWHFARWIYLSTILSFVAGNVDKFVIPKIFSVDDLGVYNIAWQIAFAAVTMMAAVSNQLIFPLYSKLLLAGQDLRPIIARTHLAAGAFATLLVAGMIAAGPTLIRCFYKYTFWDAGHMLKLLALGAWFQIAESNASSVLFAQGKPKLPAISNGIKVICLAFSIPIGLWLGGMDGLIIGFVVSDGARYVATAIWLRRQQINIFAPDLAWTLFAVGTGLIGFEVGVHFFPDAAATKLQLLLRFFVEALTVVAIWSAVAAVLYRRGYFRAPQVAPVLD